MGHVRTGPHRHTCHVTCQPAMARNLTFCLPPLPKTTTTAAAATTTTTVVATAAAATATYSHCLHCYPYIYHFAAHRATCLPVRDWARHTAASRGTPPFVASLQPFLAWYRKKKHLLSWSEIASEIAEIDGTTASPTPIAHVPQAPAHARLLEMATALPAHRRAVASPQLIPTRPAAALLAHAAAPPSSAGDRGVPAAMTVGELVHAHRHPLGSREGVMNPAGMTTALSAPAHRAATPTTRMHAPHVRVMSRPLGAVACARRCDLPAMKSRLAAIRPPATTGAARPRPDATAPRRMLPTRGEPAARPPPAAHPMHPTRRRAGTRPPPRAARLRPPFILAVPPLLLKTDPPEKPRLWLGRLTESESESENARLRDVGTVRPQDRVGIETLPRPQHPLPIATATVTAAIPGPLLLARPAAPTLLLLHHLPLALPARLHKRHQATPVEVTLS